MSLKTVYENIIKIKTTASSNAKVDILSELLTNDPDFKTVIVAMYDSTKHYKIKVLPRMIPQKKDLFTEEKTPTNSDIFSFLNKLAEQKGASDKDKQKLAQLASIDKETYKVVQMIIRKDAKSGFNQKLINKALPGLITIIPYCRCSTAKNKLHTLNWKKGIFVQEKADGMFVNIIVHNGEVTLRSRNGNEIHQLDHIKDWVKKNTTKETDLVYMGELLIKQNNKILPRKAGNGIFNSCIQNTANESMVKNAIVKLWDVVPYDDFWKGECTCPYKNRWLEVVLFVNNDPQKKIFSFVSTKFVRNEKYANDFYKRIRYKGGEGTILKKKTAIWKNHTSPDQVKMKNISEAELRIVGWSYGEKDTKYEKLLGSLQCETDDEKVKVSISGFTDEQRGWHWNEYIGKIVSIEYESVISDKNREGIFSLYLPRFDEVIYDRDETDTLEELLKR